VALRQLDQIRSARMNTSPVVAGRMLGVLQTTWTGFGNFAKAYFSEGVADPRGQEAVYCFRELFREMRKGQP
jgi:hypothetical protein